MSEEKGMDFEKLRIFLTVLLCLFPRLAFSHIVQEGETLSTLFLDHKESYPEETLDTFLKKVASVNSLKNIDLIKVGQRIELDFEKAVLEKLDNDQLQQLKEPREVQDLVSRPLSYKMKRGEVLSKVVARFYPDQSSY